VILVVDIGNTAIKVASVQSNRVVRAARVHGAAGASAIAAAIRRVAGSAGAAAAIVSSVDASATARVRRAVRAAVGVDAIVVSARLPLPIRVAVREARTVGADRLCAAVGALGGRGRHVVVVDVGTAVTVDLVVDRVFRGGVIFPGPAMSLAALHRFTAALPQVALGSGPGGIDRTDLAMRLGARLAAAGGIRAAVAEMDRRAGFRPGRVITGGYAGRILPWVPGGWRRAPDLTLLGLARIAEYNFSRRK
jgi:type III pantothenate kinase